MHDTDAAPLPAPFDHRTGALRRSLLAWYEGHGRPLPWRHTTDPYRVWLSEVMLQQTRVDTVRPRYEAWIARYPTIEALAAAPLDEVLKSWEGLGYYARARNFHRAVREVRDRYGGEVPAEREAFLELPGVGRYTAGAVLSIAFGRAEPVVDGNVRRVFARWTDDPAPADATLWRCAGALVEADRGHAPGDLNQAVMELGATVCTPRGPRCGACPVREACLAHARGTQEERPLPRRRKPLPLRRFVTVAASAGDLWLVRRRPEEGLLGGMWEFPGVEVADPGEPDVAVRAASELAPGLSLAADAPACVVDHTFSHFRAEYHAYRAALAGPPEPGATPDGASWVAGSALAELAMPRAQRRIAELLCG